jgi:hypothetical protein
MTVEEYLDGRAAFDTKEVTRNAGVARRARTDYEADLSRGLAQKLRGENIGPEQAEQMAAEMAATQMKTLAALHVPDMAAGGADVIGDFGDRNVNSRIGAQWTSGKTSRLGQLDAAANSVPEAERATTRMNARLERCK